jgi:uncharacterized protein (UPF0248 family)
MTKDQHIKYIPNHDPTRQRRSAIDRLEEFVNGPNVKAISITYSGRGIIVLYQEENITVYHRILAACVFACLYLLINFNNRTIFSYSSFCFRC